MAGRSRTIDPQKALEEDLRAEKASAMGRVARVLQEHLTALGRLRVEIEGLAGEARAARVREYDAVRAQAERYRWYLMVQREAMGLRDHGALDEHYRLPPKLR